MEPRPVGNRSSFSHGYQRSRWAEDHGIQAISSSGIYRAVHYGFSSDFDNKESRSEYAKRYQATETLGKRPDILVFKRDDYEALVREYGKNMMHDLDQRADADIPKKILSLAVAAIEIEHSSVLGYVASANSLPVKKAALGEYQNIQLAQNGFGTWLKDGDLKLLKMWRKNTDVPIFIVQFCSDGFTRMFSLARVEKAIKDKALLPRTISYQEGRKRAYVIWHTLGVCFADCQDEPARGCVEVVSKNGHLESVNTVSGGTFALSKAAMRMLDADKVVAPASAYAHAANDLYRLLDRIPKRGISGAELYEKLSRHQNSLIKQALQEAAAQGMVKRVLVNDINHYIPV